MLSIHNRCALVFVPYLAACSVAPGEPEATGGEVSQALSPSELVVAFRTVDNVHYVTAEGDGGGTISTNRTAVGAWERFIMSDLNGGSLEAGDQVQIRHVDASGRSWWLTADINGGGPGSILRANRTIPQSWETFSISKFSRAGGTTITNGTQIGLVRQTTGAFWVSAQQGGGIAGDGSVLVDRTTPLSWEVFTLVVITPTSL